MFRPYSGAGNIREELLRVAAEHPRIAQAVDIGRSGQGQPITAVRVSKDVRSLKDGKRPAVVYQAAQHAREWITPEMVRRLLHHYVDGYGSDAELTRIIDTTDLWFIPVINVDGYDYTFTEGNRLWRKNLRDNDGDGQITGQDGVDLNRNFPYKWGYDNEGSSDLRTSETYRGPSPGSEPETQAQIKLYDRLRPKYAINWHSAAQLLLYGVGWQTTTSSPDDLIHQAIVGDARSPRGAQLHPAARRPALHDQRRHRRSHGRELRHPHRDAGDGHLRDRLGERSRRRSGSRRTAAAASSSPTTRRWSAEVENNFRYAIDVAKSAQDPDEPVSPVGRTVPDVDPDEFTVSYGDEQEVAAVMRRSLGGKHMRYRINGGNRRPRTSANGRAASATATTAPTTSPSTAAP